MKRQLRLRFLLPLLPTAAGVTAVAVAAAAFLEGAARIAIPCATAGILALSAILLRRQAAACTRQVTAALAALSLEDTNTAPPYGELLPLTARICEKNRQTALQLANLQDLHEQQDTLRRDFTANVSHELKTPLTSISGYAELLKNGLVQPADIPRFSEKIYDESRRMITLVGDIIKLSQMDSKEIAVSVEDMDLYDTCAAVIGQLELAAAARGVQFTLTGEHIVIRAAEQIVEEIIFNLCDNAVKYNRENGTVTVSLEQCVDGVQLTVEDTGIGIAAADLPHIFERFYRADKSHSKAIGGTGLGLSIVKHGARFLGASISVESTPSVGTTVRVLF